MSGDETIEVVTQQSHVVELFSNNAHQFSLASHVIQKQKDHHFMMTTGSSDTLYFATIEFGYLTAQKIKFEHLIDSIQQMIFPVHIYPD